MTNLVGRTFDRLGERLPGQVSMLGEDSRAATHPARVARFASPWRVVAGAVAGLTVCNGPVLFFTSGVFLKPIAADMHWQRSTVSFALSLATFLSAVATPILGRMMDRWGIRPVSLLGLPVFAGRGKNDADFSMDYCWVLPRSREQLPRSGAITTPAR